MSEALRVQTKGLPGHRIEVTDPQFKVGEVMEIIVRRSSWKNANEQLAAARGILPKEDAEEMMEAVHEAFEQVDLDAWK